MSCIFCILSYCLIFCYTLLNYIMLLHVVLHCIILICLLLCYRYTITILYSIRSYYIIILYSPSTSHQLSSACLYFTARSRFAVQRVLNTKGPAAHVASYVERPRATQTTQLQNRCPKILYIHVCIYIYYCKHSIQYNILLYN